MTNKEFVARVKGQLNMLNKDSDINGRFILHTGQSIATSYLSMRLRDRSLYRQDNLFKPITCVEFERVDTFTCGIVEFRSCKTLMRSKKRVPKLIYSRYGASIRDVTSIDNIFQFKQSTLSQYRIDSARQGFSDYEYYYIKDGYIYIPDSDIEVGEIDVISIDQYELSQISGCDDDCSSAWEHEFIITSDLLNQVIRETVQEVYMKLQIPIDENPNLNSNEK